MTLAIPLATASAAACIASPRSWTKRTPSSNSTTPAAARALYSPRLSPATAVTDFIRSVERLANLQDKRPNVRRVQVGCVWWREAFLPDREHKARRDRSRVHSKRDQNTISLRGTFRLIQAPSRSAERLDREENRYFRHGKDYSAAGSITTRPM